MTSSTFVTFMAGVSIGRRIAICMRPARDASQGHASANHSFASRCGYTLSPETAFSRRPVWFLAGPWASLCHGRCLLPRSIPERQGHKESPFKDPAPRSGPRGSAELWQTSKKRCWGSALGPGCCAPGERRLGARPIPHYLVGKQNSRLISRPALLVDLPASVIVERPPRQPAAANGLFYDEARISHKRQVPASPTQHVSPPLWASRQPAYGQLWLELPQKQLLFSTPIRKLVCPHGRKSLFRRWIPGTYDHAQLYPGASPGRAYPPAPCSPQQTGSVTIA